MSSHNNPAPDSRRGVGGGLTIRLARVHDHLDEQVPEGLWRVLVDRLWPRGIRKARLALSDWDKDVAPSTALRKEFHSGHLSFEEFRVRYTAELDASDAGEQLLDRARSEDADEVLLLIAAKDAEHNHGIVLREHLLGH